MTTANTGSENISSHGIEHDQEQTDEVEAQPFEEPHDTGGDDESVDIGDPNADPAPADENNQPEEGQEAE